MMNAEEERRIRENCPAEPLRLREREESEFSAVSYHPVTYNSYSFDLGNHFNSGKSRFTWFSKTVGATVTFFEVDGVVLIVCWLVIIKGTFASTNISNFSIFIKNFSILNLFFSFSNIYRHFILVSFYLNLYVALTDLLLIKSTKL